MEANDALRAQLAKFLEHSEAHTNFDEAVAGVPVEVRGLRPEGLKHSPWEILEHIRLAQRDMLEFSTPGTYEQREWPAAYCPQSPEPPSPTAWDESVEAARRDRAELQRMVVNKDVDLFAVVPHGSHQTYLRNALLVGDHTAYHVGQLMLVRRLLSQRADGARISSKA
jgi:hypothetical protein